MTITFDELVEEAKFHVREANKKLKQALDEDTWGYSDMKDEYLLQLQDVQNQLNILLLTKLK